MVMHFHTHYSVVWSKESAHTNGSAFGHSEESNYTNGSVLIRTNGNIDSCLYSSSISELLRAFIKKINKKQDFPVTKTVCGFSDSLLSRLTQTLIKRVESGKPFCVHKLTSQI